MRTERRSGRSRPGDPSGRGRRAAASAALLPMLAVRVHLPSVVVPAPREKAGSRLPWRPVLFGLGAAVGFAVALGRSRTAQAPDAPAAASAITPVSASERWAVHLPRPGQLPAPLRDSIEAELTTDGPVLFSPPEAIDPIGAEALDADATSHAPGEGDA